VRHAGESLAENLARTALVWTAEAAHGEPHLDRHALPRQILEIPTVATVAGPGSLATHGTGRFLVGMNE